MRITRPKPTKWVKVTMSEGEFRQKLGLPANARLVSVHNGLFNVEITMIGEDE